MIEKFFIRMAVIAALAAALLGGVAIAAPGDAGALLAPRAQSTAPTSSASPIDMVKRWFGTGPSAADLLPPDEAYQIAVRAQDRDTLVATLTPAKDYYSSV